MLTPQEISRKQFVRAVFGGYDTREVDDFLHAMKADYTALCEENAALKDEISVMKGTAKILMEKIEELSPVEEKSTDFV